MHYRYVKLVMMVGNGNGCVKLTLKIVAFPPSPVPNSKILTFSSVLTLASAVTEGECVLWWLDVVGVSVEEQHRDDDEDDDTWSLES